MPSRLIQVLFTTSVARAQVEIQALGHNLNTGLIIIHCHCFVSTISVTGHDSREEMKIQKAATCLRKIMY